ncbi:variant erythrocyte surface antigen-1 beta subunit [Babesia bovis T2Bo]|uniref:variant erythrocyte surface antigen-1 beta subunit n=1 Tax=Babesia bovis T2Bo TaxID=484906 RepID=UPI001C355119|nr:variant erythrocyte surface antigen-1 beta subunit [Babesia bovis T2Bo]EDO05225.2 variant erythrocyte surface antigen-1 beta subunit [Babesia bovis T2Bo]
MAAATSGWTPHSSLTVAPTNLKEAIDWVLRVTGKDGKSNKDPAKPATPPQFSCLCFLAKAVKDLLYDARSPESPGPTSERYWNELLLEQESDIVHPVLTDLGLLSGGSTSAARNTCSGGTEVIKALIDQLALGLQKWVGWQEGDTCCLKGTDGIGGKCTCAAGGVGAGCCGTGGGGSTTCHQCSKCGTSSAGTKCYLSAYCKKNGTASGSPSPPTEEYYWPTISSDPSKVHLLARIFLGSVCLIWSGLSQLGFLTGGGSKRWEDSKLHDIESGDKAGLGSFMAAMGYDLERLNGSGTGDKTGQFVHGLLTKEKDGAFQELRNGPTQNSVADYYSSIYGAAQGAGKSSTTEKLCEQYPLLVLHILASGYFRAGSAGAKGITSPAKPAPSDPKKDDTPRKPRTIREILYWLSALPYSQGYCGLVTRMKEKTDQVTNGSDDKNKIELYNEKNDKTELHKDKITHYLMAACGYCPLVLIGIQGTIEREVKTEAQAQGPGGVAAGDDNKCSNYGKKKEEKTDCDENKKLTKDGKVCYRGYHLEVSKFGPLHGMYANGLFGFQMDISPAQCLDQLRVYVYHCFYQLYFLRKQCSTGVVEQTVLGWQSCRYGKDVKLSSGAWLCSAISTGAGKDCKCKTNGSSGSPLMAFLCDSVTGLHCPTTYGRTPDRANDPYPEITDHMEAKDDIRPGHFGKPPMHCPVPMGWQSESTIHRNSTGNAQEKANHFKDLTQGTHKTENLSPPAQAGTPGTYPVHCTGRTLSLLLEYYCDPEKCHGTLVVLLRLLACITPTVPRTLGDLFGFYYYIVYIGGKNSGEVTKKLKLELEDVRLRMNSSSYMYSLVGALKGWNKDGDCNGNHSGVMEGSLKTLCGCSSASGGTDKCCPYLSPLSGQQYGQLSPLMAGTYLSWLVYLIEGFKTGLSQPW